MKPASHKEQVWQYNSLAALRREGNVRCLVVGACAFVLFWCLGPGTRHAALSYCPSLDTELPFSFSHQAFRQPSSFWILLIFIKSVLLWYLHIHRKVHFIKSGLQCVSKMVPITGDSGSLAAATMSFQVNSSISKVMVYHKLNKEHRRNGD